MVKVAYHFSEEREPENYRYIAEGPSLTLSRFVADLATLPTSVHVRRASVFRYFFACFENGKVFTQIRDDCADLPVLSVRDHLEIEAKIHVG